MTLHDRRGVATWAETTRRAAALDDIAREVAHYIAADSGVTKDTVVAKVIEIIETKTNFVFIRGFGSGRQAGFRMSAGERPDEPDEKTLP